MGPNPNQIELSWARKDRGIKAGICSKSSVLLNLTTPPLVPTPSDKRGVLSARTVILTRGCVSARVQICLPSSSSSSSSPPPTAETDGAIRIAGCSVAAVARRSDLRARLIYMHALCLSSLHVCRIVSCLGEDKKRRLN